MKQLLPLALPKAHAKLRTFESQYGPPPFPKLVVSPLTGKPVDEALLEPEAAGERLAAGGGAVMRIQLAATAGGLGE